MGGGDNTREKIIASFHTEIQDEAQLSVGSAKGMQSRVSDMGRFSEIFS